LYVQAYSEIKRVCCAPLKPILQKTNLLEEGAVLKCSGGKGFYYRILCRTPFIEKGTMP